MIWFRNNSGYYQPTCCTCSICRGFYGYKCAGTTQRLHTRIAHILFMLALHSFISHAPAILCSILHPPQPTPQGGRGDTINTLLIQPRPTPTHKTRGLGIARPCFRARGGPGPGYSKIMGSISTNMTCGYVTCGRQHRENSGDFGNSF